MSGLKLFVCRSSSLLPTNTCSSHRPSLIKHAAAISTRFLDGSIRWNSALLPAVTGTQAAPPPPRPAPLQVAVVCKRPFIKGIIEPKSIGGGGKRGAFVRTSRRPRDRWRAVHQERATTALNTSGDSREPRRPRRQRARSRHARPLRRADEGDPTCLGTATSP